MSSLSTSSTCSVRPVKRCLMCMVNLLRSNSKWMGQGSSDIRRTFQSLNHFRGPFSRYMEGLSTISDPDTMHVHELRRDEITRISRKVLTDSYLFLTNTKDLQGREDSNLSIKETLIFLGDYVKVIGKEAYGKIRRNWSTRELSSWRSLGRCNANY